MHVSTLRVRDSTLGNTAAVCTHIRLDTQISRSYKNTRKDTETQAHAFMNTIRYIVMVDLQLLSELTEKLPGKCGYPPHFRECISKCVLQDGLWVDGLPGPNSVSGKEEENDTKVKTLCPLEQSEGEP